MKQLPNKTKTKPLKCKLILNDKNKKAIKVEQ